MRAWPRRSSGNRPAAPGRSRRRPPRTGRAAPGGGGGAASGRIGPSAPYLRTAAKESLTEPNGRTILVAVGTANRTPAKPRAASKGEQTREAILAHALGLATRIGFEGLTIGRLADDLRMSKSGLFAHFRSKEALQ